MIRSTLPIRWRNCCEKVAKVIDQAIGGAVKEVTGRILDGITKAMDRVKNVAGDVISAVQTAKKAAGAEKLSDAVTQILRLTLLERLG